MKKINNLSIFLLFLSSSVFSYANENSFALGIISQVCKNGNKSTSQMKLGENVKISTTESFTVTCADGFDGADAYWSFNNFNNETLNGKCGAKNVSISVHQSWCYIDRDLYFPKGTEVNLKVRRAKKWRKEFELIGIIPASNYNDSRFPQPELFISIED